MIFLACMIHNLTTYLVVQKVESVKDALGTTIIRLERVQDLVLAKASDWSINERPLLHA